MKLWRRPWTMHATTVLFWTGAIGRIFEASSFVLPADEWLSGSRIGVRTLLFQLRTSSFIQSRSLLQERSTRGKDGSSGSVAPQKKVQRGVGVRQSTSKTKSQPKPTLAFKGTDRPRGTTTGNKDSTSKKKNEEEETDDGEDVDVHQVSDATALLACRAYLVRRQRLGPWKKRQERRDRLMRSSLYRRGVESASFSLSEQRDGSARPTIEREDPPPNHIGYFWEDTSELKYYVSPRRRRSLSNRMTSTSQSQFQFDEVDPADDVTSGGAVSGGVEMSSGAGYDDTLDVGRDDDFNVENDEDGDSPAWEFASRPVTTEEEAAVDDLCDELEDGVEFQADDGATEDAAGLVVGGTGPSSIASFAYDDVPPLSYVRRSQAAKKCWSQPQFRHKWYAARWGDKTKRALRSNSGDADKEKLRRVSSTEPLPMEAVADMTEEEIAHAIRTYLSSKQKRRESRSRLKSTESPSASLESADHTAVVDDGMTAAVVPSSATLESLYPTEHELLRRRMERSERAAKAYQTRLANQKKTTARKANKRRRSAPGSVSRALRDPSDAVVVATPAAALERVERHLDSGVIPLSSDVELALKPVKLARRKQVLRRMLSECFNLRGKCVPSLLEEPQPQAASTLVFVTHASIEELGAFCLSLIRNAESSA